MTLSIRYICTLRAVDFLSLIQWIVISLLHSVIHLLNSLGQNVFQRALKYVKIHPGVPVLQKRGHPLDFPLFGATTECRAIFEVFYLKRHGGSAARRLASRIECLKNEKGT